MDKQTKYNSARGVIGTVYDSIWEIVDYQRISPTQRHYFYVLRNQINGIEVDISSTSKLRLDKGTTTVSKILSSKIKKANKNKFYGKYDWRKNKK